MLSGRAILPPLCVCLLLALAGCEDGAGSSGAGSASEVQADVTIYLSGELWERGGVVNVNPIPVPEARWREVVAAENVGLAPPADLRAIAPEGKRMTVSLDKQFGNVQFLYPAGQGNFTFRFRPHPDKAAESPDRGVRVLSVGGVDSDSGMGEEMRIGFVGMPTSGFQIFHVVAPATNERAARVLMHEADPWKHRDMDCSKRSATSVCTPSASAWPDMLANWEKGKHELDQEYRRMDALRRCHNGPEARLGKGSCKPTIDSQGETTYEYRPANAS